MNIPESLWSRFKSPKDVHVFIELVRLADDAGCVWKSQRDIASNIGCSRDVVRHAIENAVSLGAVTYTSPNARPTLAQKAVKIRAVTVCNIEFYKDVKKHFAQRSPNARPKSGKNARPEKEVKNEEKYPFDELWELYDWKKDKKVSMTRWKNLPLKDKEAALNFIPTYKALTTKSARRYLSTFINKRTWEDEFVSTCGIAIAVKDFKAKLLDYPNLFRDFVSRFNDMIKGTKIPPVDMKNGLTEERRVMFNIAYCLSFDKMKLVMEKVIASPRLNGSKDFTASYDFIFTPNNFQKIFEGVYD